MANKSDVSVLCFEGQKVRVMQFSDESWFIAKDVCDALEIADHKVTLRRLDAAEKAKCSTPTPGGVQKMRVVSESGFYKLIPRSRKVSKSGTMAHRFTNWVFSEVIPSIRKFVAYGVPWALLHDFTRRTADSVERSSQAGKPSLIRKVEKRQLARVEMRLLDCYQPQLALDSLNESAI